MKHIDIAQCMVTKKASSERRKIAFNLSFLTMLNLKKQKRCFYTGLLLDGKTPQTTFSLERIDNNIGYVDGNVIVCSQFANSVRADAKMEDIPAILTKMEARRDFYIHELNTMGYDPETNSQTGLKPKIPAHLVEHYFLKVTNLHNLKKKIDDRKTTYNNHVTKGNIIQKGFLVNYGKLIEAYRQQTIGMGRFIESIDLNKTENERKKLHFDNIKYKVQSLQERIDTLDKVYKGLRLISQGGDLTKTALRLGLPINSDIDTICKHNLMYGEMLCVTN